MNYNLKQLVAEALDYHEVTRIVFFDGGNAYYDASMTFFYKKFPNSSEEMIILGETQIRSMANRLKLDCNKALNEMELFILNGVVNE